MEIQLKYFRILIVIEAIGGNILTAIKADMMEILPSIDKLSRPQAAGLNNQR